MARKKPRKQRRIDRASDKNSIPHGTRPASPGSLTGMLGTFVRYAWAFPTTSLGLLAGLFTLCSGGRVQQARGALEFHGGFASWLADRIGFDAMTLGHVILGRTASRLAELRDHEQAHVRQVELWGPIFIPAYFAASFIAWRNGGHYYLDNWFERDARRAAGDPF